MKLQVVQQSSKRSYRQLFLVQYNSPAYGSLFLLLVSTFATKRYYARGFGRTKSTNIANNTSSRLSGSVPMTRTKSTPHGATTNNTKHSISPGRISYAMRRVFSREEKSDWHRQEAEELVVRSSSDSMDHT